MKNKKFLMAFIILAILIFMAGCGKENEASDDGTQTKNFTLVVTDKEGEETTFNISTQKKTVGEALFDEKLIEGEEGEYGLYVTKVNGIEAIYEDDGTYWAFYINGEYAVTGVDSTDVEDGAEYALKAEKG